MARDVFISHATEDKKTAEILCRALEDAGLTCWIAPRDIPAGSNYAAEIIKGLNESSALCVILSKWANESPYVWREVERSVSRDHRIFMLRIEDVLPQGPLEYLLSQVQWIDAIETSLEQPVQLLIRTIKSPPPPEPPPPPGPRPVTFRQMLSGHKILASAVLAIAVTIVAMVILGAWLDPEPSSGLVARPTGKPWLFPDSNNRELSEDELKTLSRVELFWARNEIFLRRGYAFSTPSGKAYSESLGSGNYQPTETNMNKVYDTFSPPEIANVAKIRVFESNRNGLFSILHPANFDFFWHKLTK